MKSSSLSTVTTYAILLFFISPRTGCDGPTSSHSTAGCTDGDHAAQTGTITDPSKLTISATVGSVQGYPDVFNLSLWDTEGNEGILGGKVMLQNIDLEFRVSSYTLPYGSNLRFVPDSTYTFTVVLSDGQQYSLRVHTQEILLSSLTVPPNHSLDAALTFTWNQPDNRYPLYLTLRSFSTVDSSHVSSDVTNTQISDPGSGRYTIPSSYFKEHPNMYYLSINLYSERLGTVDSRLNPASQIRSTMSVGAEIRK